jgi:hypothetical protein
MVCAQPGGLRCRQKRLSDGAPRGTGVLARPGSTGRANKPVPRYLHRVVTGLLILTLIGLAGCGQPDEITRYTVARQAPPAGKANAAKESPAGDGRTPSAAGKPGMLLGAIVPRGKTTWFFKLMGPSAPVESQAPNFARFIKSIRFPDDSPEWKVPQGWEELPDLPARFATFRIATEGADLEVTVIPLPTREGSFDSYLLDNVNRWRGQLSLAPLKQEELDDAVVKDELGDAEIWLVKKIEGKLTEQRMPPFAGGGFGRGAKIEGRAANPVAGPAESLPFTVKLPKGWAEGKVGAMQLAVYEVRDGEQKAAISVSSAGGDLLMNVNRWRGQVLLDPLIAADLKKEVHEIKVDGNEGKFVELVGPKGDTILGVIVEAQGQQWFIKLKGDRELAAREKERFKEFVGSLRFRKAK